ncbi:MAG TPA: DUF2270 domain-containing protein [Acetobacteraceae bacterium]|nr:DUF2270 domain-containing protein [Acetobacteraceae bacterium]
MSAAQKKQPDVGGPEELVALPLPSTSAELITVVAHFHRAEIGRMAGWRDRIDRTTNWAITVVAGMLSVSLSTPTAHHGVLLFAMVLVLLLLAIEARRYCFFDVFRARVRQLERNYYAQIFAPEPVADPAWTRVLGQFLRKPTFQMTMRTAVARRLRRNYFWMFLVLLLAWVLKISSATLHQQGVRPEAARPLLEWVRSLALGPVPGWAVLLVVLAFYGWLIHATFSSRVDTGELAHGEVHV